ncbi:hypothetical protein E4U60_007563 [Claviceps pazoutovae]|uniref:Xylanolytic transcriptional activator regulatory domain-containing protein n=1 Tax=Claviceps pazoutovae TaxID=1649127 RepID=A0A9P7M3L5_9HYPO|nr:hypothetical protein E4U60_007563 [Claviceps pazoutovae]
MAGMQSDPVSNIAAALPAPLQSKSRPSSYHQHSTPLAPSARGSLSGSLSPYRVNPACSVCRSEQVSEVSGFSRRSLQSAPLGQIYFTGQQFGAVCPRNGIPHLTSYCEQWISERTGQKSNFRELFSKNGHESNDLIRVPEPHMNSGIPTQSAGYPFLPEKRILESLVVDFTASEFSLVFPLINRVLFGETVRLAYTEDDAVPLLERLAARACVLAFASLSSYHFPASPAAAEIDGEVCAKAAQLIIADITEDASITTLQTVLILLLYDILRGRFQASTIYHALACRIVFALGGHRLTVTVPRHRGLTIDEHEDRHLRMLFWLCYVFDKDIALRTSQPPIIADHFCDLTLPDGYDEYRFNCRIKSPTSGLVRDPWLPGDLRLSMIKSKTLETLYSCSSLRMSDAELLKTIRELDEDLESWRTSIPEAFSPSLSIRKDVKLAQDAPTSQNMLLIVLHMDYHYLLNTIHCASGRCTYGDRDPSQAFSFGVQSSFEISVEASRSTLIFLSVAASHSLAIHDMNLLSKASQIIRSMPIRRVTSYETEYLGNMDKLVAELSRLSHCAIERHLAENLPR